MLFHPARENSGRFLIVPGNLCSSSPDRRSLLFRLGLKSWLGQISGLTLKYSNFFHSAELYIIIIVRISGLKVVARGHCMDVAFCSALCIYIPYYPHRPPVDWISHEDCPGDPILFR
ncbi:hypothetical protein MAP00_008641 [Monascus purpureus]|nr:hypothetical protein MAP00_008641 [Monascus purpureus]